MSDGLDRKAATPSSGDRLKETIEFKGCKLRMSERQRDERRLSASAYALESLGPERLLAFAQPKAGATSREHRGETADVFQIVRAEQRVPALRRPRLFILKRR